MEGGCTIDEAPRLVSGYVNGGQKLPAFCTRRVEQILLRYSGFSTSGLVCALVVALCTTLAPFIYQGTALVNPF